MIKCLKIHPIFWLLCVTATIYLKGSPVQAQLPSTENFMNMLTTCGAGSRIFREGNFQQAARNIYEIERQQGKSLQDIATKIFELLPANDRAAAYRDYLRCIERLSENFSPTREKARLQFSILSELQRNTPRETVQGAFGPATAQIPLRIQTSTARTNEPASSRPHRINGQQLVFEEYKGEDTRLYRVGLMSGQTLAFAALRVPSRINNRPSAEVALPGLNFFPNSTQASTDQQRALITTFRKATLGSLKDACTSPVTTIGARHWEFIIENCFFAGYRYSETTYTFLFLFSDFLEQNQGRRGCEIERRTLANIARQPSCSELLNIIPLVVAAEYQAFDQRCRVMDLVVNYALWNNTELFSNCKNTL